MPPTVTGTAAAAPRPAVGAKSSASPIAAKNGSCESGVEDISTPFVYGYCPIAMAHHPWPITFGRLAISHDGIAIWNFKAALDDRRATCSKAHARPRVLASIRAGSLAT